MAKLLLHEPGVTLPRIETLWAFLARSPDGNESLLSHRVGGNQFMPLITASKNRLPELRSLAEAAAAESGMEVVLVEFTGRVDVRTIGGKPSG